RGVFGAERSAARRGEPMLRPARPNAFRGSPGDPRVLIDAVIPSIVPPETEGSARKPPARAPAGSILKESC
ncbi:MAG: hypothetical protein ACRD1H_13850, partial [Vicinamibacterales bacterium]